MCWDFTAEAVKSKGPAHMGGMCSNDGDHELVENEACPTANLIGSCSSGPTETIQRYYSGTRGHNAPSWTAEGAASDCKDLGPDHKFQ